MRKLFFLPLLFLVGCETHEKPRAQSNSQIVDQTKMSDDQGALTPVGQSESQADKMLTQKIQQLIKQDKQLSSDAKKIKITALDGVVTLQGRTADVGERMSILEKIRAISGVKNIKDQLETREDDFED